jgi:hypothetical protein
VVLREEIVLPYPAPLATLPVATEVRGTVLVASLRGLRSRGYGDAYLKLLKPTFHDAIASLTPAVWLPMDLALAHYEACDRLALPPEVIESIGAESGRFVNKTVLTVVARLSQETGLTPWVALGYSEKLRQRTWVGSGFSVVRLGPKEARLEWAQQPAARYPYFRAAFGAFAGAILGMFARRLHVREIPRGGGSMGIKYKISWV